MHFVLYFSVVSTLGLVGKTSAGLLGAVMEEERRLSSGTGPKDGNGGGNGGGIFGGNGGGNDNDR